MPVLLQQPAEHPGGSSSREQDLWAGERAELKILLAESKTPSRGLQSDGLFFFFSSEQYTISMMSRNRIALDVLGI